MEQTFGDFRKLDSTLREDYFAKEYSYKYAVDQLPRMQYDIECFKNELKAIKVELADSNINNIRLKELDKFKFFAAMDLSRAQATLKDKHYTIAKYNKPEFIKARRKYNHYKNAYQFLYKSITEFVKTMPEYQRKEGESKNDYIWRVYDLKSNVPVIFTETGTGFVVEFNDKVKVFN